MVIRTPQLSADVLPPFRRRDLPGLLLSRHELDALLAAGLIVQPVRGVYLDARAVGDPVRRAQALGLVLPPDAAVGRRTAAWVHGVDARGPGELDVPLPLEVVVRTGTTPLRRAGVRAYEASLPEDDIAVAHGVPVTTPLRTACDLARYVRPFVALGCLDAIARIGLCHPAEMLSRLRDWSGERNVARARRLVRLCDPRSESPGESWTRLRIIDAGFPAPETQVWIRDHEGTGVYRLDLGWSKRRIAIEYDGREFHSRPEHIEHDRRRREDLARRFDWHVVGVGMGEVLGSSLAFERGVGELLGMEPQISRRTW